jgi:hypothetical protein
VESNAAYGTAVQGMLYNSLWASWRNLTTSCCQGMLPVKNARMMLWLPLSMDMTHA